MEISINNISKIYNPGLFKKKVQAVKDLTLDVRKGEVYGLIGPNGAGKSTTLRVLLGLIRPDKGEILFRGKPLQQGEFQKQIGYLPENPYLYDYLTLKEILDFSGKASGCGPVFRNKRISELTEKLQLSHALHRPLRTFSKGMLQRAGICFALLHDPSVVILDEPMSGLDPIGRKLVFDIVAELKEVGKTIFFCSHVLSDVERLCDRIGVLSSGRLVKVFEKKEFVENEEQPLHLLIPGSVSDFQLADLKKIPVEVTQTTEGYLLSVSPPVFLKVADSLGKLGIPVNGTRTSKVSLEELFLHTIEVNNA